MKILELTWSLASGGAEKFAVGLSNELYSMGHDVTYVCIRDLEKGDNGFNKIFFNPNINVHSFNIPKGQYWRHLHKIHAFINNNNFDIVHFNGCFLHFFIFEFMRKTQTRFFHTIHNVASGGLPQNKILKHLYCNLYQKKKVVPIAISKQCADSLYPYGIKKMLVSQIIDNGCSESLKTDNFDKVKAEIDYLRKDKNIKVLLHVARFAEPKRQNFLFQAVKELADEGNSIELVVLGNNYDSPEAKELVANAGSHIHILGKKTNVGDYLHCADAFVLSSAWEGLPISLIEALSAGCIPICTAVGGIPDVIEDGVTGFLAKEVSVEAMKDAIKRYLANPKLIKPETLKQHFAKNFSMRECADKYIRLFESVKAQKQ